MEVSIDERNHIHLRSAVQGGCFGITGDNRRAAGIFNLVDISMTRGA